MTSILNGVQEFVTPSFLSRVSSQTGESEAAVSKGFAAMLPMLLGWIANRSSDTGFMSQLTNLATSTASDPEAMTRPSAVVGPDGRIDPGTTTGGWLSSLTGGSLPGLSNAVARYAGVRASSASSMLTYAAPLVLGYLGRLMRSDHLDAPKLAKRLQSERGSIAAALPAGFESLVPGLSTEPVRVAADSVRREKDRAAGWLLPLLLLALAIGGLLWWGLRDRPAQRVTDATTGAAGTAGTTIRMLTPSLPGGVKISIPAGGMEDRLIRYLSTPSGAGSFDFDRIEFQTGSTSLTPQSRAQLTSVATILKAYPSTRVVIVGYTDNSGDEATNVALSRGRAEAVLDMLRSNGVPATNLQAQGFGSQNPIADNSTEAGRARNRRVTLQVS
jgi:outer membrane protein OmpA-like peptidoglycan-associated protein